LLAKWVYLLVLYNEFKHNVLALVGKANKDLSILVDDNRMFQEHLAIGISA
jgi:hypothetical protein